MELSIQHVAVWSVVPAEEGPLVAKHPENAHDRPQLVLSNLDDSHKQFYRCLVS